MHESHIFVYICHYTQCGAPAFLATQYNTVCLDNYLFLHTHFKLNYKGKL